MFWNLGMQLIGLSNRSTHMCRPTYMYTNSSTYTRNAQFLERGYIGLTRFTQSVITARSIGLSRDFATSRR